MKARYKLILFTLLGLLLIGLAAFYYVFNKPHRSVENEEAIQVSANQLFGDYQKDEQAANKTYLDKAIEVKGEVVEIKKNQEGRPVVVLKSADPFFGVVCTLKEDAGVVKPGEQVVVKGLCSGFSSDVVLRDCIIQN